MKVPAVAVLTAAGFHVPVIPSSDISGSDGGSEFWQYGPIGSKVGVISAVMTTCMMVWVPHCAGSFGVKV